MMRRVLVIANETLATRTVHELLLSCGEEAELLVVAPALSSRLNFWMNDDRRARRSAEARLAECLEGLQKAGHRVEGAIGDADPLIAIDDALCGFDADTLVIVTHPPGQSNWLERDVVDRAQARFEQPIIHVIAHVGVQAPV